MVEVLKYLNMLYGLDIPLILDIRYSLKNWLTEKQAGGESCQAQVTKGMLGN